VTTPGPRTVRLFVAVELPDDVRDALDAAADALQRAGVDEGLRWVRPEGIHITLKFLGATPEPGVPAVEDALRRALAGAKPFELQPEGFGAFHGGRNPHFRRQFPREAYPTNLRVLWVGVAGDTGALAGLASRVEGALAPMGFPTEKRAFSAHLTLARVRDDATPDVMRRLSAALEPFLSKSRVTVGRYDPARVPRFPAFRVERVSLMRSTLQRGGAVYDAIAVVPLD
jgi:2'-5' RNA ligase